MTLRAHISQLSIFQFERSEHTRKKFILSLYMVKTPCEEIKVFFQILPQALQKKKYHKLSFLYVYKGYIS